MKLIKGSCLCSDVECIIADDLKYSGFCHCSQCRGWTGAPFSTSCGVAEGDFQMIKGQGNLAMYKKGDDSKAHFCKNCSALVYGEVPEYKMIYIMLGTLSESPVLKPQWHVYTNYKVDWFEINDNLTQYKEEIHVGCL